MATKLAMGPTARIAEIAKGPRSAATARIRFYFSHQWSAMPVRFRHRLSRYGFRMYKGAGPPSRPCPEGKDSWLVGEVRA